ncbi:MAG: UDP-4-amino-4,6-dideoxy-N-acetyl-beta-L-altrosamine transaminase [Gammaproteobacteria bacterium]|nr:UDP-4-amino-4,6-dideoxy-N-acetyl-beta-L-altrosamine transaminase [Gammaproteobacteria bacterium]
MIPYGKHFIDEDDVRAVARVLQSGTLTQGPAVDALEAAISSYVGSKYAVAVSSCTAGLHLAAVVAGVKPGSTLVTSPITFVASANAGLYTGGRVEFIDIDPATINMSPNCLERVLSESSGIRAVVPVHFAGLACDMAVIGALAENADAMVIEDAAHALGARYADGRMVGCCAHSTMTVFSLHPVKAIAAGEGGVITTNDEYVYRKLLRLRSHGINKLDDPFLDLEASTSNGTVNPWYYEMQELGFHYRITDIQCALALSQLGKIEAFIARRRELVDRYDRAFANMAQCRPAQKSGRDESGHHLYVLRIDFAMLGKSRLEFMQDLRLGGVGTQVHYIPVPAHPHYRRLGHSPDAFPDSKEYYEQALSLPLFYDLTDNQQAQVISAVAELVT